MIKTIVDFPMKMSGKIDYILLKLNLIGFLGKQNQNILFQIPHGKT